MVVSTKPIAAAFRKPTRVTITIAYSTYLELESRSHEQGRSLSNLAAFLLESAIHGRLSPEAPPSGQASGALTAHERGRPSSACVLPAWP